MNFIILICTIVERFEVDKEMRKIRLSKYHKIIKGKNSNFAMIVSRGRGGGWKEKVDESQEVPLSITCFL